MKDGFWSCEMRSVEYQTPPSDAKRLIVKRLQKCVRMAYLEASQGVIGKTAWIWGRDVENVECGVRSAHVSIYAQTR